MASESDVHNRRPSLQEGLSSPQGTSSLEQSAQSSTATSRRGSTDGSSTQRPRQKSRVRFESISNRSDLPKKRVSSDARHENSLSGRLATIKPLPSARLTSREHLEEPGSSLSKQKVNDGSTDITDSPARFPLNKKRGIPQFSLGSDEMDTEDGIDEMGNGIAIRDLEEKAASQRHAQAEAEAISQELKRVSGDTDDIEAQSESVSPIESPRGSASIALQLSGIQLENLRRKRKKYGIEDDTESEEEEEDNDDKKATPAQKRMRQVKASVKHLIHSHRTPNRAESLFRVRASGSGLESGRMTPMEDISDPFDEHHVPNSKYRRGVLGSLLKMYHEEGFHGFTSREKLASLSTNTSPSGSGATTPTTRSKNLYKGSSSRNSSSSLMHLLGLGSSETSSGESQKRPPLKRPHSSGKLERILGKKKEQKPEHEAYIQIHIEEQVLRYQYLISLCRALMAYGAPTHRLEEYMRMTAKVLEINGKFLFMPGCMLMSFEDPSTLTSDVRIVRNDHSVDLGKLLEMHDVYKAVAHDHVGVREGIERLDELALRKPKFGPWTLVLFYGLASATVGPFAFDARWIDLPIAFLLGSILGILKVIISSRSDIYANVFEVLAAVITSFLARAFGSIWWNGARLFCFSALAQSSIALILPGYIVLCGALELQSRNIVAGSVRMVYAIIYSLFLGFGITIGTSFYGGIDKRATSETTCQSPLSDSYWPFMFVPMFTFCLIVINQGKWSQVPVMIIISVAGYMVNHFAAYQFASNLEVSQTLGALAIGLMGNAYSRFFKGLSAAALIPAIFVQVPSGLAAGGTLISGLTSANQITNGTSGTTTLSNATQAVGGINVNTTAFDVAYSMIQVAIGITVGLFFSALLFYPFGKKRSGLFSF